MISGQDRYSLLLVLSAGAVDDELSASVLSNSFTSLADVHRACICLYTINYRIVNSCANSDQKL